MLIPLAQYGRRFGKETPVSFHFELPTVRFEVVVRRLKELRGAMNAAAAEVGHAVAAAWVAAFRGSGMRTCSGRFDLTGDQS